MKINFSKIQTSKDTLNISLDNGETSVDVSVSELLENGYSFDETGCDDFEDVVITGALKSVAPTYSDELNDSFKYVKVPVKELSTYLSSLDSNALDMPYRIKLTGVSGQLTVSNVYAIKLSGKYAKLKLDKNVTSIGSDAFSGCTSLTSINYTGTEEQWNTITKDSDWNYGVPDTCVVNYNYTE